MAHTQPKPEWGTPVADPQTAEDAVANLRHTVAVWTDAEYGEPDTSRVMLAATGGVYGREETGLRLRDLVLLLELLDSPPGMDARVTPADRLEARRRLRLTGAVLDTTGQVLLAQEARTVLRERERGEVARG